jgi:HK97 family phage major capsid protein
MPNIDVVRARKAEIEAELVTIHTGAGERALNDEETTRWESLESERVQCEKDESDLVAAAQRAQHVAEQRAAWGSVQVAPVKRDLFADLDRADRREIRNRAREVVSEVRYDDMSVNDLAREVALRYVDQIPGAAELIMATSSPDYMSAFRSYMRSQGAPLYTQAEAEAVRASMSLTSANGGYSLPFLLDPTLIHTGSIGRNPIRSIARVETGTQNVWHGVTVSNVTSYWKGEGSAFTDGSPTTAGPSITAAQLTAYVTGSLELFEDSNLLSQLPGLIAESFDDAESAAYVVGSGSTAPKGIITAISATAGCLITATTRGSFTAASAVDTFQMLNAVPSRYEDNATWVGNKATFNTIRQQTVGTAGVPVVDMMEKGQLLGSPWVSCSSVTSTTTSGNFLMVLGDFRNFVIYDRLGTSIEFLPTVVDGSGLPTGQRGLIARKRTGSDVVGALDAFRIYKA